MIATKFTPGPWRIETPLDRFNEGLHWDADEEWNEDYPSKVAIRPDWKEPVQGFWGAEIASMSGVHERTLPDAYLIAAAPELYDALKAARWYIAGTASADGHALLACIDTALAKARGEA